MDRFDPGPQPSGRSPAPGRLGLVQAFANAFWDLDRDGADEWGDADEYAAWLAARGFGGGDVGEADRLRAVALREAVRDLARRHHDDPTPAPAGAPELAVLDEAAARAALRVSVAGDAPVHVPVGDGPDDALALVVAVVAEAMADGTWTRLKACPGPHCGWVFFDGSKNRSRQWCSMQICGNRVKGREFRARRRSSASSR
ncbi:CGNR zinc finger domain-containing protein [Baekduia sp. Peel2402]|uniref:CGNR zinc finger domain-containing protein n=1 Tax=Baekduia sp. Peel2402 TaxID=3458296 RepID=UPI00403EBAA3